MHTAIAKHGFTAQEIIDMFLSWEGPSGFTLDESIDLQLTARDHEFTIVRFLIADQGGRI